MADYSILKVIDMVEQDQKLFIPILKEYKAVYTWLYADYKKEAYLASLQKDEVEKQNFYEKAAEMAAELLARTMAGERGYIHRQDHDTWDRSQSQDAKHWEDYWYWRDLTKCERENDCENCENDSCSI